MTRVVVEELAPLPVYRLNSQCAHVLRIHKKRHRRSRPLLPSSQRFHECKTPSPQPQISRYHGQLRAREPTCPTQTSLVAIVHVPSPIDTGGPEIAPSPGQTGCAVHKGEYGGAIVTRHTPMACANYWLGKARTASAITMQPVRRARGLTVISYTSIIDKRALCPKA